MNLKIGIIILICLTNVTLGQKHFRDSLHIKGEVSHLDTDELLSKAKFEIFINDTVLWRTVFSNDSGEYAFKLPLYENLIYTVKVSYPKYVYKIFQVNTKGVPSNTKAFSEINAFIGLFEADSLINYDLLDLPLMRYSYNPFKDNFEYDKTYMEAMRAALGFFERIEEKNKKEKIQDEIIIKQNVEKEISKKELSLQKTIRNVAIIGAIILLFFLFFVFSSLQKNIRQKKIISEKHLEIEEQKRIIEEKQKDIIDSITYARRIQRSLLPTEKYIDKNLTKLQNKKHEPLTYKD